MDMMWYFIDRSNILTNLVLSIKAGSELSSTTRKDISESSGRGMVDVNGNIVE